MTKIMKKQKLVWHTEKRKVNSLIPYVKNPRVITKIQEDQLDSSVDTYGYVELVAINTDGVIIAGHRRVESLKRLGRGEEEIEVRVPNRKLSKKEFRAYLLISNRSGGTFDFEKLASDFDIDELLTAGFDSLDLSNIFDDNLEINDDEFSEEKEIEKAKTTDIKIGDKFKLGRHYLICADALNQNTVKELMGSTKADLIDVDLPYNISLSYDAGVGGKKGKYGGHTNDSKTDEEYREFVKTMIKNSLSVAKEDVHCAWWCDERYVFIFQQLFKELGIDSKRLLIWVKNNQSVVPKNAFNKITEFVVYGTIGRPYLNDKIKNLHEIQNKEITTGNRVIEDILDLINIWLVKRIPGLEMKHPTEKNPTIHEKILRRCTRPGDVVLDLTAGSGSMLSACEQLKRTAYLCEIEPIFCQVIINRFKQLNPNEKIIKLN